jgi:hypothetical protein
MMKTVRILRVSLVLSVFLGAGFSAWADSTGKLDAFRASFEKRLNSELDEHGAAARELRTKYLDALRKLKLELGREENLKGAAQVVAEIEAIEDGEEAKELPKDADFKFARLRMQWERGLETIQTERAEKLRKTVTLYLKALDAEKRKLTRAGEIKDALLFDEEEKRVNELPEVRAALGALEEPGERTLADELAGSKWLHSVSGKASPSGVMKFSRNGKGDYKDGAIKLKWEVTGKNKISVTADEWESPLILTFNKDRSEYEGRMAGDSFERTGKRLGRD